MEEMNTNVDYNKATENIGKLFQQYTAYIVESTANLAFYLGSRSRH